MTELRNFNKHGGLLFLMPMLSKQGKSPSFNSPSPPLPPKASSILSKYEKP